MAKQRSDNPTAHTLEEIQALGDRLVERVTANPVPVVVGALLLLGVAAGVGFAAHYRESRDTRASAALEAVRNAYLVAMGAEPGAFEPAEPANPETARSLRRAYVARFSEVAEEHAGRPAAALAWLEVGDLELQLGDEPAALAGWGRARDGLSEDSPARALALARIARAHEQAGRWSEAARVWSEAAALRDHPLRYFALADAARCAARAGDAERAIALHKRIVAEAPETPIPEYVSAQLRELEAAQLAARPEAP